LDLQSEDLGNKIMKEVDAKDSNLITFSECLVFIYECLGKMEEVKELKAKKQFDDTPQGCMLNKEILNIF